MKQGPADKVECLILEIRPKLLLLGLYITSSLENRVYFKQFALTEQEHHVKGLVHLLIVFFLHFN